MILSDPFLHRNYVQCNPIVIYIQQSLNIFYSYFIFFNTCFFKQLRKSNEYKIKKFYINRMIKSIDAKLSITLTSLPFTIHIFLGKSYFLLIYVIYNKFHVLYIHITQSQSFVFYKGKFSKKYVLSHFLINLRYLLCTPPLVPIKYLHLMIGIKSTHSCTAI